MSRILLATQARERGGVWKHVLDLADGFVRHGHQVLIAIPPDAAELELDLCERGLPAQLGLQPPPRGTIDIAHLQLAKTFDPAALRWLAAHRGRVPTVVLTEHLPRVPASDPSLPWEPTVQPGRRKPGARHAKTLLKRIELALTDAVITVSASSSDFLQARYGVSASRIHPVPNGVALLADESPVPQRESVLRVVCVGTLAWRKGYDVLIDAARLAREPWHVTVVGTGPSEADFRRRAEGLTRVRFDWAGHRPDAYRAALDGDVLCLPSRSEAMPYAVLEAMSCGRAVVATAVDGLPELVTDGVTGVLVPTEDPAALAAALDSLARDRPMLARFGSAGREKLAGELTIEHMVLATLRVYDQAGPARALSARVLAAARRS